jgi:hypothetical protein
MIPTSGKLRKNHRVRQEGLGKRKQYSGREFRGIIPVTSGIWPEDTGQIRNTASIKSPEFPGTDRFLAVLSDLGTEYSKMYAIFFISYKSQLEKMLES